ncbi:hypothetical protein [Actinomadura hibisca]|uniref:hypothetical protein n=1 Tax=Actinomadura hibisca TaxID=68565 RepID=UPI0012FBC940|nr:hypothetical protein [Actinomadura hibisca]
MLEQFGFYVVTQPHSLFVYPKHPGRATAEVGCEPRPIDGDHLWYRIRGGDQAWIGRAELDEYLVAAAQTLIEWTVKNNYITPRDYLTAVAGELARHGLTIRLVKGSVHGDQLRVFALAGSSRGLTGTITCRRDPDDPRQVRFCHDWGDPPSDTHEVEFDTDEVGAVAARALSFATGPKAKPRTGT